ncbi:ankyrin repeat domain-containing protein [Paraglaciecola sp.]|uniref:ankyrin repeat domain-containing protein n=1 Tax=Paraglaciecola sp. TaxID=1920173 RepID=UPI003263EFFB
MKTSFRFRIDIFVLLSLGLILLPLGAVATYLQPKDVDLINAPINSIQKTIWKGFPVIIHRRTEVQLESIRQSFKNTPLEKQRFLAYQSIARKEGNVFASAIRQFTENYIAKNNLYMSEIPEYGIYSQVSPVLGCAIFMEEFDFIDPCNNIRFDFAGKVKAHKGYEHLRLTIPPHKIVNSTLIFIEDYEVENVIDFTPDILEMSVSNIEKALLAIDWERLDILKVIVEDSPEVLVQTIQHGSNVLHLAASHETTLDYLLDFKNVQVNQINNSGYSPLLFAILMEHYQNAEKLIQRGAKLEAYSIGGKSAPSVFEFIVNEKQRSQEFANDVVEKLKQFKKNK